MEGQIDLKHMKKAEKKALRPAVVTSLMGGLSVKVASATYHIAESTVQVWKRMWREAKTNEPERAIQEGQRGRRMGACRTLTPEQEEQLQSEIVGKTPDQYQYEFALWSAQAVKLHILKRFGIDMPDRIVRFYLKRWGWTPQHPIRKAYEQNPRATQEWLETTYPAIKEEAKENKGIIYWGDETGVQAYANRPRGYSPRGVTPEARIVANRGIKLKEQVVEHMKKRSQDPTTVAKLFQHPKVAYAADDNHSLPK